MTRNYRIEGMRSIRPLLNMTRSSVACISVAATLCWTASLAQGVTDNSKSNELEEVVITGIRASLERSIEIKRSADSIVDSIASEDLGKFPDANVAEALQRITGVSINRNDQGEGTGVTVRGFGPQFNATLLNGRVLPAAGTTGLAGETATFGFDQVAAELISGADVYKSSNATLQEGGIGSLINMRTARPFDTAGSRVIVSAKGTYDELAEQGAPSFFALYSTHFADDRWGALISGSYQKRKTRRNSAGVQSYLPHQNLRDTNDNGTPFDPSDDIVTPVVDDVYFPRQQTHQVDISEPTRLGVTGVLQFRPNDNLLFTLDTLWSRYKQNSESYQLSHYFTPDNITAATVGANNTVTSLTTNGNGHTDFTRSFNRTPTTTQSTGLNVDWKALDGLLTLNFDVSHSTSINDGLGNSGFAVVGYPTTVNWAYSGSGLPSLSTSAGTFTDPTLAKAHFVIYGTGGESKEKIDAGKIDGVLDFGDNLLSKLRFGTYLSSRSNRNESNDNNPCAFCGYWQSVPSSLLSVYDAGSDFLGGGNFPTAWLSFDPDAYVAYLRQAGNDPSLYTPQPNASGSTYATEKIAAVYLQTDFAGTVFSKPWNVNVGLRYTRTKVYASGAARELVDLENVTGDPTTYNGVYADNGAVVPVAAEHTYNNVLPTFNARLNLTDEVVTRFAASQTLTRPRLSDLTPRFNYDTLRPNNLVASAGNPDLKPYVSTNFDLSLEWYYAPGGYATLALFKKTVDDYIVTMFATEQLAVGNSSGDFPDGTASFRVKRPRNVETAKVQGVEVAFQHSFSYLPTPFDGFGFGVNATFVDSPSTLSAGDTDTTRSFALEGVGNSQNLMAFYEKGPVGLRVSYNHRDDYLKTAFNGEGNEPLFVKGSGQLDAQASYRIGDHWVMTLEGSNITNTREETYGRYENQWISLTETGARYALGVRATF